MPRSGRAPATPSRAARTASATSSRTCWRSFHAAGPHARAPPERRRAPVRGGRRSALVERPGRPGHSYALLGRSSLAPLRGRRVRQGHRRPRRPRRARAFPGGACRSAAESPRRTGSRPSPARRARCSSTALRAVDRALTAGAHGLPLIGSCDWNDGFNNVGPEGRGESIFVGWFLHAVLRTFASLCDAAG